MYLLLITRDLQQFYLNHCHASIKQDYNNNRNLIISVSHFQCSNQLRSQFKMFLIKLILISLFSTNVNVQCAKILGVFNIASISHQIVFQPIWKELSLRGHEVTIMSPNPLRDPSLVNLTEIDLSFMYESFEDLRPLMAQSMDHWAMLDMMVDFTERSIEDLFGHENVMAVIRDNTTKFDVVLVEAVVPAAYAFAAKFKCPLIGVASLSTLNQGHEAAGTPNHPILYPDVITTFTEDMTYLEKFEAVIYHFWQSYRYYTDLYPLMNRVVKKYFGEDTPNIEDLAKNMSMLFLNTNPILHGARPFGPNVVQLGRMHLKPKRPLPAVSTQSYTFTFGHVIPHFWYNCS